EEMQRHNAEISNIIRQLEQRATRSIPVLAPTVREDGSISYLAIESGVDSPSIPPSGPVADSPSDAFGQTIQPGQSSAVTRGGPRSSVGPIAGAPAGAAAVLAGGLVLIGDPALPGIVAKPAVAPPVPVAAAAPRSGPPRRQPSEPYGT